VDDEGQGDLQQSQTVRICLFYTPSQYPIPGPFPRASHTCLSPSTTKNNALHPLLEGRGMWLVLGNVCAGIFEQWKNCKYIEIC
jgi:hypothetical protein